LNLRVSGASEAAVAAIQAAGGSVTMTAKRAAEAEASA
jgi:ribosomal protein L15